MPSKARELTKYAYDQGYRITEQGTVINTVTGNQIATTRSARYGHDYPKFSLRDSVGARSMVYVHQLQAFQLFEDLWYKSSVIVRHLDGDVTNNTPKNIAIGSHRENIMDETSEARSLRASKAGKASAAAKRTRKMASPEEVESPFPRS